MTIGKRIDLGPAEIQISEGGSLIVGMASAEVHTVITIGVSDPKTGRVYAVEVAPGTARMLAADLLNLADEIDAENHG